MKINQSSVAMSSEHTYSKVSKYSTHVFFKWEPNEEEEKKGEKAADLSISDKSRELMEQQKQLEREEREQKKQQETGWGIAQSQKSRQAGFNVDTKEAMESEIIKRLIEMLESLRYGRVPDFKSMRRNVLDLRHMQRAEKFPGGYSAIKKQPENGTWTKQVITSGFMKETENTSFSSVGMVKTADGREINFGISLEMSRSFEASYGSYWEQKDVIYTDPLVINLDTDAASVSDQKFLFDLDCDGKEEDISYLGKGSGFLSLDKNGDGVINDGSELFGTKSGNGFKDLAVYDEDGNGWIDENDSVFNQLKVWTKNDDGTDRLVDLKKAGVGAIYLGNVETPFSLNSMENNQNHAVIRSSGIFLKESGEAGTVQHVDFSV